MRRRRGEEKSLLSTDESDEALVERVKAQDVAAFTLLYDRYAPAVYASAAHLLNSTDAEDVVQEGLLRLWNKADRNDERDSSRAGISNNSELHNRVAALLCNSLLLYHFRPFPSPKVDTHRQSYYDHSAVTSSPRR